MKIKTAFNLFALLMAVMLMASCSGEKNAYSVSSAIIPDADLVIELLKMNADDLTPEQQQQQLAKFAETDPELAAKVEKYSKLLPTEAYTGIKMLISAKLPEGLTGDLENMESIPEPEVCLALTSEHSLQPLVDAIVADFRDAKENSIAITPADAINGLAAYAISSTEEPDVTPCYFLVSKDGRFVLAGNKETVEAQSVPGFKPAPKAVIADYRKQLAKDINGYAVIAPNAEIKEALSEQLVTYTDLVKSITMVGISASGNSKAGTLGLQLSTDDAEGAKKFHDETLLPLVTMAKFLAPQMGLTGENALPCINTLRTACSGSSISIFIDLTEADGKVLEKMLPKLSGMLGEGEEQEAEEIQEVIEL